MNFKKVIIYDHKILFNILDELKENFQLNIIHIDKKDIREIKEIYSDNLVISKMMQNEFKNNLVLDKNPVKLVNLIESINLKLIKERFIYQSNISIGEYKLNLNSRKMSSNTIAVDLTEREINLIIFLRDSPVAVKIDTLQKEVWDYGNKLETHTVETHIYRLRKKIKDKFGDDHFILSSKEGYLIK